MGYSMEELTVSRTAERKGLSNLPATEVHEDNLDLLEDFLESLPFDFRINSAYRSPDVNRAVGGASSSQHMNALAVDMTPEGLDNKDLATWLWIHRDEYPELDQVIWYTDTTHVHIGICPKGAEDCRRNAPRSMFMFSTNEAGSYTSWEPDSDEIAEIDAAFPQGRKRNWMPWLISGSIVGVGALLFFALRHRRRR